MRYRCEQNLEIIALKNDINIKRIYKIITPKKHICYFMNSHNKIGKTIRSDHKFYNKILLETKFQICIRYKKSRYC